jgi:hypothetical protein
MSTIMEGNQKKKAAVEPKAVSWQEKKSLADKEEEVLRKEVEDLEIWVRVFQLISLCFIASHAFSNSQAKLEKGRNLSRLLIA